MSLGALHVECSAGGVDALHQPTDLQLIANLKTLIGGIGVKANVPAEVVVSLNSCLGALAGGRRLTRGYPARRKSWMKNAGSARTDPRKRIGRPDPATAINFKPGLDSPLCPRHQRMKAARMAANACAAELQVRWDLKPSCRSIEAESRCGKPAATPISSRSEVSFRMSLSIAEVSLGHRQRHVENLGSAPFLSRKRENRCCPGTWFPKPPRICDSMHPSNSSVPRFDGPIRRLSYQG